MNDHIVLSTIIDICNTLLLFQHVPVGKPCEVALWVKYYSYTVNHEFNASRKLI